MMKRAAVFLLAAAMVVLFAGTTMADDLYGCIVNNTGQAQVGTVQDAMGNYLPFQVNAGGTACMKVSDGSYNVSTKDGLHTASFTASFNQKVPYGDGEVYWLVTLQ